MRLFQNHLAKKWLGVVSVLLGFCGFASANTPFWNQDDLPVFIMCVAALLMVGWGSYLAFDN